MAPLSIACQKAAIKKVVKQHDAKDQFRTGVQIVRQPARVSVAHKFEAMNSETRLNVFVALVILLNSVLLGIEIDHGPASNASRRERLPWILVDTFFIIVFSIELVLRMKWEGSAWLEKPWNFIDGVLVVFSITETFILPEVVGDLQTLQLLPVIRIVKMVRIVRLAKLVQLFKGLYIIVMAYFAAMSSMLWMYIVLVFGLFMWGMLATCVIGKNKELGEVMLNFSTPVPAKDHFGTVPASMYSLFELMTLEGFQLTVRPLVMACPPLFVFFTLFIMMFTFGLLNMMVGLIVEKTLEQTKLLSVESPEVVRKRHTEQVQRLNDAFEDVERNAHLDKLGLHVDDFDDALQNNYELCDCLSAIGLHPNHARELFDILDVKGDGLLDLQSFTEGCLKVMSEKGTSWDVLAAHAGVRHIIREVLAFRAEVQLESRELLRMIGAIESAAGVQKATPSDRSEKLIVRPTCHEACVQTESEVFADPGKPWARAQTESDSFLEILTRERSASSQESVNVTPRGTPLPPLPEESRVEPTHGDSQVHLHFRQSWRPPPEGLLLEHYQYKEPKQQEQLQQQQRLQQLLQQQELMQQQLLQQGIGQQILVNQLMQQRAEPQPQVPSNPVSEKTKTNDGPITPQAREGPKFHHDLDRALCDLEISNHRVDCLEKMVASGNLTPRLAAEELMRLRMSEALVAPDFVPAGHTPRCPSGLVSARTPRTGRQELSCRRSTWSASMSAEYVEYVRSHQLRTRG